MHGKITKILRLYSHGMGIKSISATLDLSRNTVRKYIRAYQDLGKSINELLRLDEEHLQELLFCGHDIEVVPSQNELDLRPLLSVYASRLRRNRKLTKKALYAEYITDYPHGYSYSTFCSHLRSHMKQERAVGHVEHIPGDQMYIDYAGDKLYIKDARTGENIPCEVAVIILPASGLTYVEAVSSQRKEDLIKACENALHYYGGAPMALVPDNLKAAVVKTDAVEPVIQEDFAEFAEHYGCAVYPARVRHPQDKALVENAVKLAYREIYPTVEGRDFHSLVTLNKALREALEAFNDRQMAKRPYSRRQRFEDVEKDTLRPLPAERFPVRMRKVVTVRPNSYLVLNRHHYSVPARYVGKRLELIYDDDTVSVYYNMRLVTSHRRDDAPYEYSTKASHKLPGHHPNYDLEIEELLQKAADIDHGVYEYLHDVAEERKYPPQAYRTLRGMLALQDKYGRERFIRACHICHECHEYGYTQIQWMLRNGEDYDLEPENGEENRPSRHSRMHVNIRGKNYFKSESDYQTSNNQNKKDNENK